MLKLLSTGLTGFALALATIQPVAAQTKLDMPNEYQASSLGGLADTFFVEKVGEKTNGALEIVPHFGGSLGYKSADHFSAVEDGAVPLAHTFVGVLAGVDPIFQVNTIPFLVSNVDEMQALVEAARPYYDRAFEKAGQRLLFVTPWTPVGIWAKKPIRTVEELQTINARTYDVNGTIALKAAGANAIQLTWADVVPALATGTIDSVLTSDEGGIASKFWEHTDHFNQLNFTSGLDATHMNIEVFEGLPEDQQQALLDAAAETEEENWVRLRARIGENVETMKANGVEVVSDVSPELLEHLREASKVVAEEWLAKMGPDGEAILAEYNSLIGR